jgi:hypothetical protein
MLVRCCCSNWQVPHKWECEGDLPEPFPCSVTAVHAAGPKQIVAAGSNGTIRVWFYDKLASPAPRWILKQHMFVYHMFVDCTYYYMFYYMYYILYVLYTICTTI